MTRTTAILLAIFFAIPPACYWAIGRLPQTAVPIAYNDIGSVLPTAQLSHRKAAITPAFNDARPRITNVRIVDLEQDGRTEILCCDAVRHTIWLIEQANGDEWKRTPLLPENSIATPAHAEPVDLDGDGDTDIVVAGLRSVWPTDERIGRVLFLQNDGSNRFTVHVLADDLRRVTDVQPGDFDADGDMDLAVAEFGYLHGRVLWLENKGDLNFADHELLSRPGAIHVPVGDYDNDGDPDIAAVVSQNDEAVWIFENTGSTVFEPIPHRVWGTTNFDIGLAGMIKCDLDLDGDEDFLLSAGDNLELAFPCPQPGHGCIWLENHGNFRFEPHRIASLAGTYASATADMDNDGDIDVVLGSMLNNWTLSGATSLAWLENDGQQNFQSWHLAANPTHLCTVACGDLNADGRTDIVAGTLQIFPPFKDNSEGVTIWLNRDQTFAAEERNAQ